MAAPSAGNPIWQAHQVMADLRALGNDAGEIICDRDRIVFAATKQNGKTQKQRNMTVPQKPNRLLSLFMKWISIIAPADKIFQRL